MENFIPLSCKDIIITKLCHTWYYLLYISQVPLCEQEYVDFPVVSPSSSAKGHRGSMNDMIPMNVIGEPANSFENIPVHKSLSNLPLDKPQHSCCQNRDKTALSAPLSKSVIDVSLVHSSGSNNTTLKKAESLALNLPKTISSSILYQPLPTISPSVHQSDERFGPSVLLVPSSDSTLESCPLVSSISSQIVPGPSSKTSRIPSSLVIVHKSQDKASSCSIHIPDDCDPPPSEASWKDKCVELSTTAQSSTYWYWHCWSNLINRKYSQLLISCEFGSRS